MHNVFRHPWWVARPWLKVATIAVLISLAAGTSQAQASSAAQPVSCSMTGEAFFPVRCVGKAELVKVTQEFAMGYLSEDGPEEFLPHIVNRVMLCESSYNRFALNDVGPFVGLMQFLPSTWHALDGGNWTSPREQGVNTARLLADSPPETQWPHCWFA